MHLHGIRGLLRIPFFHSFFTSFQKSSGYPQGLSDDEILLEARILAVADVVEAMASHRPYRPPLGIEKALEELSENRGRLYDSRVVDACIRVFKEKNYTFK